MNEHEPRAEWYDAREVNAAAAGRWADVLGRLGADTSLLRNVHGPCPGCGGRDRFRFDDKDGSGSFICSQGGGGNLAGGGIALVMHMQPTWDWKRAINEVGAILGLQPRHGAPRTVAPPINEGVAAEPRAEKATGRPEIDMEAVKEFTRGTPPVDAAWLSRRSPQDVRSLKSGDFLNAIFSPGDRVLIFTNETSQGDFLWCRPEDQLNGMDETDQWGGGWRLSQERGVRAVRSELPRTARNGVWFLVQPVSGKWEVKPDVKWHEAADGKKTRELKGMHTRRSAVNVTAWRHFVLESDELPADDWLRVVVNFPLPIAALYTSGSRSIHALLRMPVGSKAEWDAMRDSLRRIVCPLGADPGALSAVRLSRLPGCLREGTTKRDGCYVRFSQPRPQELLYLDPHPDRTPLRMKLEVRDA